MLRNLGGFRLFVDKCSLRVCRHQVYMPPLGRAIPGGLSCPCASPCRKACRQRPREVYDRHAEERVAAVNLEVLFLGASAAGSVDDGIGERGHGPASFTAERRTRSRGALDLREARNAVIRWSGDQNMEVRRFRLEAGRDRVLLLAAASARRGCATSELRPRPRRMMAASPRRELANSREAPCR